VIVEEDGFWRGVAQRFFPHRPPPPPEAPPTREELVEALAQVDRQLEILNAGPLDRRRFTFESDIAELQQVREGLVQCLAEFEAPDPDSLSSPSAAIDPAP